MALNLGAQKIYTFYSQPLEQVVLALNDLVLQREKLELFTPNSKGLYEAAAVLASRAKNLGQVGLIEKIDRALISMISVDLIRQVIGTPSDQEALVSLSSQIFLITAATDTFSAALKEIKPYDDDEMGLILEGRLSYYDDILFVYTLRKMMTGEISSSYFSKLLNSLPHAPKEEEYAEAEFYWSETLITGLILQVAWANLADLSVSDRKFLFQNYFYHSIVAGVPVKDRLLLAFKGLELKERDAQLDNLLRSLDYNEEYVPSSAEGVFGVKVSETVHQILLAVYDEKIKTFAQEKFISDFYEGEANTAPMQRWLRELLSLVIGIHQHTL